MMNKNRFRNLLDFLMLIANCFSMCFYYCLPHLYLPYFFTLLVVDILRAFENVRSVATSLSLGNLKAFHLEV